MDYAETLVRMRQEIKRAQLAFLSKRFAVSEAASIELLRLSCKLLDEAEASVARQSEAAGKPKGE